MPAERRTRPRPLSDAERWRLLDDLYRRVLLVDPTHRERKKGRAPFQSGARPATPQEDTPGART